MHRTNQRPFSSTQEFAAISGIVQNVRRIVLASASPRRQELLARLVTDFNVAIADVDETPLAGESPWQTAERLAKDKAHAILVQHPDALVLSGDTVVALRTSDDYEQLAKPADEADASRMLRSLSAKTHLVITGVCLLSQETADVFSVTTEVTFRTLAEQEIAAYVGTGEPMDKAGAYAIQSGAAPFVDRYEGSLTNVIGFPIEEIAERLSRFQQGPPD